MSEKRREVLGDQRGEIVAELRATARALDLPVDRPAYEEAGLDPLTPIPCAGDPRARICVFARDLGRSEVRWRQPLVGAAGQRVRRAVLEVFAGGDDPADPLRERALRYVFLANAVPYKPPGNRPYPQAVVERFRPAIERLLVGYWRGCVVFALGREAARWFEPYAAPDGTWRLSATIDGRRRTRRIEVVALPHPSPANARWASRFPGLFAEALRGWRE